MQPHIAKGYLLLHTAAQIWSIAEETYGQLENDAQMYELQNRDHIITPLKKRSEYLNIKLNF